VSNVNEVRAPGLGATAAGSPTQSGPAPRPPQAQPPPRAASPSVPSVEGTAILNLSTEQFASIRRLLVGLRNGKSRADEVRAQIFNLLSGGQRRVIGAAWFIISVRV
jgi:hypothetical protein